MPEEVEAEITGLIMLRGPALRERWREVTGKPVPLISRAMLRLALAWELQAAAQSGHTRRVLQRLDQLAGGNSRTVETRAGMRLVREWNGVVHVVTVEADGTVMWNDKAWKSLSEVARTITGTRWSGPAFFGLRKKTGAAA